MEVSPFNKFCIIGFGFQIQKYWIFLMRIYLDMCSFQRPLDNKTKIRVSVEAEAILNILTLCESGQIKLVSSPALIFEADKIKSPTRKTYPIFQKSYRKQIYLCQPVFRSNNRQRRFLLQVLKHQTHYIQPSQLSCVSTIDFFFLIISNPVDYP